MQARWSKRYRERPLGGDVPSGGSDSAERDRAACPCPKRSEAFRRRSCGQARGRDARTWQRRVLIGEGPTAQPGQPRRQSGHRTVRRPDSSGASPEDPKDRRRRGPVGQRALRATTPMIAASALCRSSPPHSRVRNPRSRSQLSGSCKATIKYACLQPKHAFGHSNSFGHQPNRAIELQRFESQKQQGGGDSPRSSGGTGCSGLPSALFVPANAA